MGEMLVLSRRDVEENLTMEMAVRGVERAYLQKAEGKGLLFPLVTHAFEEGKAEMDIKSGCLEGDGIYGFKQVSWFGGNPAAGLPAVHGAILKRARIYADDLTQSVTVGECEIPVKQGLIGREDLIGELGGVLTGNLPGRLSPEDITVFDSSGIALQDLVVAKELVTEAKRKGKGRYISL